jgi:hypothetical protein
VQEADLGEVLAQVGRQAGIRISSGPSAGKRVSARFASVENGVGEKFIATGYLPHIPESGKPFRALGG